MVSVLKTYIPTIDETYNHMKIEINDIVTFKINSGEEVVATVKNIEVIVDQSRLRPIDANLQVPNTTKFENHTGWTPQIKFNETMDDLLEYWRDRIKNGRKFLNR